MAKGSKRPGGAASHEFSADEYKRAAEGHAATLERLYGLKYYVPAVYLAGVAVECIFRAYRARFDPVFDARHNLHELHNVSKFAAVVPEGRRVEVADALTALARRWSNSHRYRSLKTFRAFLVRGDLHKGIHGDVAKENCRVAVAAPKVIVEVGVEQWTGS